MLKTHNVSGIKYLCKTSKSNPFTYSGSGKIWKRHLRKYGRNFTTEILAECKTKDELVQKGLYYSNLWDVVNNKEFANLVLEAGDGGATMLGKTMPKSCSINKSKSLRNFYKKASAGYKLWRKELNSKCHEMRTYITPKGAFTNSFTAAVANNCSNVTVINRCVKDTNKPIESKRYWKNGWKGKTWRELGWYNLPLNT
jgi:hypothetical protein